MFGIGKTLGFDKMLHAAGLDNTALKMAVGVATGNPAVVTDALTDVAQSISEQLGRSLACGSCNASPFQPLGRFGGSLTGALMSDPAKLRDFGRGLQQYGQGLRQLGSALGMRALVREGRAMITEGVKMQKIAAALTLLQEAVTNLAGDLDRINHGRRPGVTPGTPTGGGSISVGAFPSKPQAPGANATEAERLKYQESAQAYWFSINSMQNMLSQQATQESNMQKAAQDAIMALASTLK
jgi:hypothetical protein